MKTLRILALGAFLTASSIIPGISETLQQSHYVVIGAFAIKKNAVRFTAIAAEKKLSAKFEMNPNRQLYYVYVLITEDLQRAIDEALRLRSESPYNDTWVYHGSLGEAQTVSSRGVDINPTTQQNVEKVVATDVPSVIEPKETQQLTTAENSNAELSKTEATQSKAASEIESPNTKGFFLKAFRTDNSEAVEGDITVVDTERSKKVGSYAANRQVRLSPPGSQSGNLSLICEIFGYRKIQRDVNYNSPEGENIVQDENNNIVIPFELVRLQKGDIAVMYNVYFFKDAALMRPESRYEVNSLVEMMKEDPKYKIRIHGHTNGNAAGKIISKDSKSENFFSLTDTHDGIGSAKKLSEVRAEILKEYLINNGIDPKRMEIKAWGGKRPVVDKMHTRAEDNVRVEIEILEN